jgi:tetratricopeptide (TPR) repeat protein
LRFGLERGLLLGLANLAFACLVTALCVLALSSTPAQAQTPAPVVPVALTPVQRDTSIELVALTLDADIAESNGHTILSGNSTFKLHNTDKLNDLQAPVGFPAWAGDPYVFDPTRLDGFSVTVEGKKVTLIPSRADLKIGSSIRSVDWYTFTLALAADEKKTVRFEFQQDLGDATLTRIAYGIIPATAWKGSVGSARLTINFPAATTMEQIVGYDPPNPAFDGESLTWRFTTHEPPANPTLTILRPSAWADLVARRRAVQASPGDSNAHAALGDLLRRLAQTDSARRDSFTLQAIAELETASRLDPSQRTARQGLGSLYELRAGPASGPRQTAYVSLAVIQWQALASTDASARKQLAEDYFYLGLDAQTRGQYAEALTFFDKATALAPSGAGPLFTLERVTAQKRALNISWANSLLDKDDFAGATEKANAALSDLSKSFAPPAFTMARAQVRMAPSTRTMVFRLVPFAVRLDSLKTLLDGIAASLGAGGAQVSIESGSSDLTMTLSVPFLDQEDLQKKLQGLGPSLPTGAEWSLMHAVLSPPSVAWDATSSILSNTINYREQSDLAPACSNVQTQLQNIGKIIKPLENAPAVDAEAQLRLALLKKAQAGWQSVLTQGRVNYGVGSNEMRVDPCTTRTVTISTAPFRLELIIPIVLGVVLLGMLISLFVWRGKRPHARAPRRPRPPRAVT